ncbi:type I restriction endonuclease [Agromyces aerolatus]|uniref:type I restriction endonuclease n=1 Tax=Agromyces sp. LY-1074 TaxID=3074080 RepID=UPI00285ECD69|nr:MULTISPECIES: type I restriction endonuclease [unclassified Agromyces]MDR5701444.1 type I restriction enzyme HsdR N-terminal domain-containing protein [Agromyces sp. LY-1074]MDR5704489.1 type I restriction enzyme HsdR N-terminal domain-containing protein [Agromyces sp. LY-1358]
MEFEDRLSALATKVKNQAAAIGTEEATKNAFVMPFISTILGYDVFDPLEVVPEFTADVGIKKGEKVDYAIMRDGEVQILIECKASIGVPKVEHASQLFRYFSTTNARIAALTNGVVWQFFTDLDAPNRMDAKPFLVLDLLDIDETLLTEVQKLSKDSFDLESIINAAEELKYVGALKREIAAEFRAPSDEWIKFFATRVYDGAYTQRVREQFTGLVTKASRQFLTESVNDRLKTALGAGAGVRPMEEVPAVTSEPVAESDLDRDTEIETTLEELEGYQIVKAIACGETKPQRITHRDAKSYFAVLLDDNNRKPIARLHFNGRQKYLGLLDAEKTETRHPLDSLDEIYEHADAIREAVVRYR